MSDPVVVSSRSVHDGRIVKLSLETVRLPNGNMVTLELIRHPGAAAAVPIDAAGNAILIRQYRHATGAWLLEVPAGKLDYPGESPEECALREVEEETGYRAGRLEPLAWIWTTPGFTNEKIWLYAAYDLTPARANLQADEVLTVEPIPLAEAVRRAVSGEIADGKSVCTLLRAAYRNR
jgi:ADP-ribose pyrophosphatase